MTPTLGNNDYFVKWIAEDPETKKISEMAQQLLEGTPTCAPLLISLPFRSGCSSRVRGSVRGLVQSLGQSQCHGRRGSLLRRPKVCQSTWQNLLISRGIPKNTGLTHPLAKRERY